MSKNRVTTITMVGPSGSGKTSLLASMYYHIRPEIMALGCSFTARADCEAELGDRQTELEKLATDEGINVDLDLGTKPSPEERTFEFDLHVKAGIPDISLKFVDLPGGWYTGSGEFETADKRIAESDVLIIAVEAWALMEKKENMSAPHGGYSVGKYNKTVNKIQQICMALERASHQMCDASPPMIILVAVKGEKYLHNGQQEELLNTMKEAYSESLKYLREKKFPIAACCVETIGGLELNSVMEQDGKPWGKFRRLPNVGYAPKHCSIPLRFVFQIALTGAIKNTREEATTFWERVGERVAVLFGRETDLSKSIVANKELKAVAQKLAGKLEDERLIWINGY